MNNLEHAKIVRQFFSLLFLDNEYVYIFPGLNDIKIKWYKEHPDDLPDIMHGRYLYYREPDFQPYKFLSPFRRKASSVRTGLIDKLNDFASLGYDIYFAANPLTCQYRCQRTTRLARHVVLESDSEDYDAQLAILREFRLNFSAVVFSGHKSLHAFAKIDPPLINYKCVGYKIARDVNQRYPVRFDEYERVAKYWIKTLGQKGLKIDQSVALDYSRLSRLPGFPHSKTNKNSEVIWLDTAARGVKNILDDIYLEEEIFQSKKDSTIEHNDEELIINNKQDSETNIVNLCNVEQKIYQYNSETTKLQYVNIFNDEQDNKESIKINEDKKGISITAYTDFIPGSSFLTHLSIYYELVNNGISRRGLRYSLHVSMFVTARIMGWDEIKLADEWEKIVNINPENIGITPEEAVSDIIRHFETGNKGYNLQRLPNMQSLPIYPCSRRESLLVAIRSMGCLNIDYPTAVANIILKVLWPFIISYTNKCCNGSLGIRSDSMRKVSPKGLYRPAVDWMIKNNIIRITKDNYFVGKHTRKYFINIPLILFIMGFKEEDVSWKY